MFILCTSASDEISDNTKLPPYERNGNGTPVRGIIPNIPPKFINIWANIKLATPIHMYLPLSVEAFDPIVRILCRIIIQFIIFFSFAPYFIPM